MTKKDFIKAGIDDFYVNKIYFVHDPNQNGNGVSSLHINDIENFDEFTLNTNEYSFYFFILKSYIYCGGSLIEETISYLVKYPDDVVGSHIVNSIIQREYEIIMNDIRTSVSAALSTNEPNSILQTKFLKFNEYVYVPSTISAFNVELVFGKRSRNFETIRRLVY